LSFIAPTAAGSAYDVESRAFAKEMGAYLGATINVVNMSTGQSIPGQDSIAAAIPNGLTIGFFNTASDIYDVVTNAPGVNFNLKNVALLGGLPNTIPLLATQSSSSVSSFAALGKSAASPPRLLVTSGASATQVFLLMREFGIKVNYITGYANSSALVTGFIRGDGQLVGTGIAELQNYVEAGVVRPLALMTDTVKPPTSLGDYAQLSKVPTVAQLLKQYPATTNGERAAVKYANAMQAAPNFVVGAPSATPTNDVAALVAAVKYAARSGYVESQVNAVGNLIGYTSPTVDKKALVTGLALAPKIATFLGY
jgi:hypothetical protein